MDQRFRLAAQAGAQELANLLLGIEDDQVASERLLTLRASEIGLQVESRPNYAGRIFAGGSDTPSARIEPKATTSPDGTPLLGLTG